MHCGSCVSKVQQALSAIEGVEDVVVIKKTIYITLKIISEQFKDNDESTVIKKQDIWTFQKEIDNNSPTWFLSST